MWTAKGSSSPNGVNCAMPPATSAPAAEPRVKARDARRAPAARSTPDSKRSEETSFIQLVPTAIAMPTVIPESSLPT